MANLWTPWRLAYILSDKAGQGCVFCRVLAGPDEEGLVVARGEHAFALLNRYPYNNGHVMIAPRDHVATLGALTAQARAEIMDWAGRVEAALTALYRPDGLNCGINLGRAAGAGVVGHLHLHVVPRWEGDTNYMAVVNDVRVIPERLEESWAKLRARLG